MSAAAPYIHYSRRLGWRIDGREATLLQAVAHWHNDSAEFSPWAIAKIREYMYA